MLSRNPYGANAYRAIGIETGVDAADPLGLVVMLYDGAVQAIVCAQRHLRDGEIALRGIHTSKAIDIVTQGLLASLDRTVGGDLVDGLASLYEYMGRRLFAANLNGDHAIYEEVSALLKDLRVSWVALRAATAIEPGRVTRGDAAPGSGIATLHPRGTEHRRMSSRMELEQQIVERYRRMADASRRMLAAARIDDWDTVCGVEKECADLVVELSGMGDLAPRDPALHQQKVALMKRVLADDAEIRQLSQPWLHKLDVMMRGPSTIDRLNRAYGSGSYPS